MFSSIGMKNEVEVEAHIENRILRAFNPLGGILLNTSEILLMFGVCELWKAEKGKHFQGHFFGFSMWNGVRRNSTGHLVRNSLSFKWNYKKIKSECSFQFST